LVDKIIDAQLENGQFSLTPLTFKDIDTIKSTFKERLKAIYHTRISYPEEKKEAIKKKAEAETTEDNETEA
jgi:membrane-associated HD superfamily phosphohydrolase